MSRPAFVLRFLALFALLIVGGWLTAAPRGYAAALRLAAAGVSPLVTGWNLERRPPAADGRPQLWFRRGAEQLRLALGLEQLALGLLPLLALLGATPGLGAGAALRAATLGIAALFALDLLVVVLYPWLVRPGALTDITGTFLGLLTFVGGPVILWFALTFRHLRPVWRL